MIKKEKFNLYTDVVGNCYIVGNDWECGIFTKLEREQCIRLINKLNEMEDEIDKLLEIIGFMEIYEVDSVLKVLNVQQKTIQGQMIEIKELDLENTRLLNVNASLRATNHELRGFIDGDNCE